MNSRLFGMLIVLFGCCLSTLLQARVDQTTLAILVNDADSLSVEVGRYYQQARHIDAKQVIHLKFATGRAQISPELFAPLKAQIDRATPALPSR